MNNRRVMHCLVSGLISGALLLAGYNALAQEAAPPATSSAAASAIPPAAAAPALILQGQGLFFGTSRFSGGGPSCNSCHNLVHDAGFGGGTLAMDLTESFGRLNADGIADTLPRKGSPSPFTVMQAAFQGRDITAEEVSALTAFMQDAHAKRATQKPNDLGAKMLPVGIVGVVLLLLLSALFGRGRKRRSVNQEIFDRQVMSE